MAENEFIQEREIALWGPTSSGKTWLVLSLGRALRVIQDPEFEYTLNELGDSEEHPVNVFQPPKPVPTQRPKDERWLFTRRPHPGKSSHKHVLSSHAHVVNLHDLVGKETVSMQDSIHRITLWESEYILLMLDHTLLISDQDAAIAQASGGSTPQAAGGSYTRNQYAEMVFNLFQRLEQVKSVPHRFMAVCFTKVDLLGVQKRDPWQLIDAYFGPAMLQLLRGYQTKWKMEAFSVSAAGYLPGATRVPNYDPSTLELRQPDLWQPYNVQAPFFWLFERIELQRLQRSAEGLGRFFFKREKDFINYPISLS